MLIKNKMTPKELINLINENIDDQISLEEDTPLVGGDSTIDSMNLVQICIALEDKSKEDGFSFDWTSEKAMSSLNSIFKNPLTLSEEYNNQKTSNK